MYIFDLDGTLLDSQEGVLDSLKFAVEKCAPNYLSFIHRSLIGPPITALLREIIPDKSLIEVVSREFRFHYDNIGCKKTKLFPGVYNGLKELSKDNILFIATNKPQKVTNKILTTLGVFDLFQDIKTIDLGGVHNKSDMVKDIMLQNNIIKGVVIGDSQDDYMAAIDNQLDFIFCSYGYGSVTKNSEIQVADKPVKIFKILQR